MKKALYIIISLLFLYACTPDDIPPIGEPFDRQAQLVGTWNLSQFMQVDEEAKAKDFPEFATYKDLTNVFPGHPYTDFALTLNSDGSFSTTVGTSYVDILSSGTWALDDVDYPTAIVLTSDDSSQEVLLGSLAELTSGKVQLKAERKSVATQKTKITYEYHMVKQ